MIITAVEFFKFKGCEVFSDGQIMSVNISDIIDFAVMHKSKALEEASKKVHHVAPEIDADSILEAYPDSKIE